MSERVIGILADSFMKILMAGIRVTIPLSILSFFFALIISVAVAIVQYADIKGLKQFCRFYIWIIRGTPLLVQLYLVFYGMPSIGILLPAFPAAVPSLSNSFISMVKSTSMASTITVSEMIRQTQIINGRVYQSLALYLEVGFIYLIFCTVLTWLQGIGEKKLNEYGGAR